MPSDPSTPAAVAPQPFALGVVAAKAPGTKTQL